MPWAILSFRLRLIPQSADSHSIEDYLHSFARKWLTELSNAPMFQVTAQDIAALNDIDLRAVIALTAEAEVRRYGYAGTSISWGGDQRANDGGVDVEARLASSPVLGMSIPRSLTGFQAKAEKMPAAKITKEMRPKGVARPIFGELASAGGAYIIISSKENLTKTSIDERLNVMRKALSDVPGQEKLDLGFMDSSALATWVRGYAGPSVWVLNRIARRLRNWKPFSPWAYAKEGIEAPYLVDEHIRVHIPDTDPGTDSSALVALEEIRSRLRKERGSVRIVGLSGVGKTRFAQALFDERLGTAALDHTLAVYTDIGNEPDPEPNSMISDLIVSGMRGVVIVDNCRPAVHRRLAETAADPASKISLLTIEYDVRDEELEDTDVFVLNAASDALVEKLLGQRFPNLSHSDIHTIAKMAGGNLRIAIAIASTGGRSGSFATLKSDDLIARLFYQGNARDPDLLRSGHILALPYSFSVENAQSSQSELALLAELGETTVTRLYEQVRTIQERELIQQRGEFRALLPPGISNHLAQAGLKRIPPQRVRDWLARVPIRLLKSVAHRLSFLQGSPEAEQIAEEWLSPGGLLGSPDRLGEDLQRMFLYIAALRPSLALESLDRASVGLDDAQAAKLFGPYADLLHWLAYDAALFDRSVNLLVRIRAGIERKPPSQPVHDPLYNMFQLYLSGTHATVEQRIAVIEPLLAQHPCSVRFSIGINALKSLLNADDFSGVETRFGALSRDYGLWPLGEDLKRWLRVTLSLCEQLDLRGGAISAEVRTILADEMRDLWFSQMVIPELQALAKNFSKRSFWPAGWIAANSIGKWRDDKLTKRSRAALPKLVSALRPSSLRDRVLTFAERKMQTLYFEMKDHEEDYTAVERRVYEEGLRLGNELAIDLDTLRAVLPEILVQDAMIPVHPLAAGLAEKLRNPSRAWKLLQTSFLELSDEKRKPEFLAVFLSALQTKEKVFVETILNELSNDPEFAVSVPRIQCAVIPGAMVSLASFVRSSPELCLRSAIRSLRISVIRSPTESLLHCSVHSPNLPMGSTHAFI